MNTPDQPTDSQPFDDRLRDAYDFMSAPPDTVPPPPDRLWAGVEARLQPAPAPLTRFSTWRPALTGAAGVVVGVLLMAGLGRGPAAPNGSRGIADHEKTALAPSTRASENSWVPVERSTDTHGNLKASVERSTDTYGNAKATVDWSTGTHGNAETTVGRSTGTQGNSQASVNRVSGSTEKSGIAGKPAIPTPAILPGSPPADSVGDEIGRVTDIARIPTVLLPLVQTETSLASAPADTTRLAREQRRATLRLQRAELARLQHRTDSLLLAAGEPGVWAPTADTVAVPLAKPLTNRWSVALTFAPERNFFGLGAPATDTLSALRRTHEQGRAGYNAALLAEYRLTPRWSVGAGVGITSYGAELRLTDRHTLITVAYDTQTTHATQTTHVENKTYSIRIVQEPVLSPVFNLNQQIIGYDTVLVPRPDTVWTHVITNGTVETNTTTTTPTVTKREEMSSRILRPNYRFLTLPVLVRYRFGTEGGSFGRAAAGRWWTDVALGAQVQLFLGGTQLTSPDGRTWRTERVAAGEGPFRPLTVALTGAVALNYALTPRLSASLTPTLRYQTESVYRPSTGLTQRPAATGIQMGLKLAF